MPEKKERYLIQAEYFVYLTPKQAALMSTTAQATRMKHALTRDYANVHTHIVKE